MKFSSAMVPFWMIYAGTSAAWRPTLMALWHSPPLIFDPAKVSKLFMAHLWTAFADPIDEGSRELKESLITANAYGIVLDLGAGFGHTAKHLDRTKVTKYVALEPNVIMHPKIRKAAAAAGFNEADGTLLVLGCGAEDTSRIIEALGEVHSVDTVVSFLTLCSIPRPQEALTALVREVLKSGGTFVFNEHVLNPLEDVAWWQRAWTPIWKRFLDGCHLDRPTHLWIQRMDMWAEGDVQESEEVEAQVADAIFYHKAPFYQPRPTLLFCSGAHHFTLITLKLIMKSFISVAFVAASLAASGLAHAGSFHEESEGPVMRRKTLGFGPSHPHAVFRTNPPYPAGFAARSVEADPTDVARSFVEHHLAGRLTPQSGFTIRKDSYTDANTGVTHVYIRQLVNGIEVADGDFNVNVKDGRVISYGDSFYPGPAPESLDIHDAEVEHTHTAFCSQLENEVLDRQDLLTQHMSLQSGEQVTLGASAELRESIMGPLDHLYASNCAHVNKPYQFAESDASADDGARRALLQFMIAATPNDDVVQDILARYDQHLQGMTSSFETHLVGDHGVMQEVIDNVPDTVSPVKAKLAYIQVPKGNTTALKLVWKFEVEMKDNWYEASVSATAPHRIISVVDWASDSPMPVKKPASHEHATYNVFKWGINDPAEGNRTIEKENYDALASPVGWHALPAANDPSFKGSHKGSSWVNTTTTAGNNVWAHEDWEGRNNWLHNYRPDAGKGLEFNYTYDPKVQDGPADSLDEAKKYINATITQLFYTSNMVHDVFYRYGFDEVSGNFQQHNFGRGGEENDAVIANAQDGSGYNNANFMTPPDGQNGRCRMYLWNTASPYRDGDLEAGIVIHELAHGLSTRLTGGPANSGCLGWGEAGGMGEGWGDFLATTIRSNANYSDYAMGAWAANRVGGIRNYVYSLDNTINPSTYKTLDKPGYWGVHAIGEVWAEILWVVSQGLISDHGYSDTLYPPHPEADGTIPEGNFYRPQEYTATGAKKPLVPKHGNTLMVQLVLNGMKLQQCRPDFFDARDAIIQADQVLTGGENFCTLWNGFASRGLGPDARVEGKTPWGGGIRTNDLSVPLACKK
ncbi:hypothetical protein HWV62_20290 [Athelia sp. TMB]|nr:hypothetical protein HWV62_20290 [Athelia sp. TMB]